jgi:hypothetical protein
MTWQLQQAQHRFIKATRAAGRKAVFYRTLFPLLMGIACSPVLAAKSSSAQGADILPPEAKNSQLTQAEHPNADVINRFLDAQKVFKGFVPTGNKGAVYLDFIEGVVGELIQYQNEEGDIVDPWYEGDAVYGSTGTPGNRRFTHYATPHYAHAAAVLLSSGRTKDPKLLESAIRAVDASIRRMIAGRTPSPTGWVTGDFYPYALMNAYLNLRDLVPGEVRDRWQKELPLIDAAKTYSAANAKSNWVMVCATGEFLRAREGFTTSNYTKDVIGDKLSYFAPNGTWKWESFAYDSFPRYHVTNLLNEGYDDFGATELKLLMWRGAWMSLLMQSPSGQHPTGFRSSHHVWNEAALAAIFEIYATQYARNNQPQLAGAFKRGAALATQELARWKREEGGFHIVKNRQPPQQRQGYEGYSLYTCYNALAAHMLAMAYQNAEEAIAETPAPADTGGFVLVRSEDYSKDFPRGFFFQGAFANVLGSYVQYNTNPNTNFDPPGLQRVNFRPSGPTLGPTDGMGARWNKGKTALAIGPAWKQDGTWTTLSTMGLTPSLTVLEESPTRVSFQAVTRVPDETTSAESLVLNPVDIAPGETWTFDGRNSHAITQGSRPLFQGPFTLGFWARVDRVSKHDTFLSAFTTGDKRTGFAFEIIENEGLRLVYRNPPGISGGASQVIPWTPDAEWHHFLIRSSGKDLELLVDGEEIGSIPAPQMTGNFGLILGRLSPMEPGRALAMDLKDFFFVERALPEQDVRSLASKPGQALPENSVIILNDGTTAVPDPEELHTGKVTETVTLEKNVVRVDLEVQRTTGDFDLVYPFVASDGKNETAVSIEGNRAVLRMAGNALEFRVMSPDAKIEHRAVRLPMELGLMDYLIVPITGRSATYEIRPLEAAAADALEAEHTTQNGKSP